MKKIFSIIAVLAIVGILAAAGFGSAADLRVQGGTIQAGADYDLKLYDIAEVNGWGLETDDGMVSFVRLGLWGAQPPLGSGNEITIFVNITDGNHAVLTQGSVVYNYGTSPIATNIPNLVINFDNPVPATDIWDIHVFIEGSANSGATVPDEPF